MATAATADLGSLRVSIGADTTDLESGMKRGIDSLKGFASQAESTAKDTLKNIEDMQKNFMSFGSSMTANLAAAGERVEATLSKLFTGSSGVNAWGEKLDPLTDNLKKLGLEGGQVTGTLQRVEGGFVQIAASAPPAAAAANELTVALKSAGDQGVVAATGVSGLSTAMQALIGGSVVAGATTLLKTIKDYGDKIIEVDLNARRAMSSLLEFQTMQQALFVSGNVGASSFATGMHGLAKEIDEAVEKENDLDKILKLNNKEFEDENGEVISTNKALLIAADLIRNAKSELDKLKIADAFGLPHDFIPALEKGSEAIRAMQEEAERTGTFIDSEMVDKAQKFSEAWRRYSTEAVTWVKAFAVDAAKYAKGVTEEIASDEAKKEASLLWTAITAVVSRNTELEKKSVDDLKVAIIADFQEVSDNVRALWDRAFGTGETDKAIQAKIAQIKALKEAARIVPSDFNYETAGGQKLDTSEKTKIPEDDDKKKSTEALQRRLDQIRQELASEDEAVAIHQERQEKALVKFREAGLITNAQFDELERQSKVKYYEKIEDLIFTKFEEQTATEQELLTRKYLKQMQDLNTFEAGKTGSVERWEAARKKITDKYALDTLQAQAKSYSGLASIVDTSMGAISQIVADESNKGFTVMKAISMATALVKGFEAAVSAYAFGAKIGGPPLGIAMAGVAAAGTAAIIAKLAGVGPGGGGSSVSAGGGGGGAPAAAAATAAPGPVSRTLDVSGLGESKRYSASDVRSLLKAINEWRKDGDVVTVR